MDDEKRIGEDPAREMEDVASFTECTGLKPALPPDEDGDAAQASLYAIHGTRGARKALFRK